MPSQVTPKNPMPITTETTATDAVLAYSRLVAQHNMLATDYADIPKANRDIYYQALALVSAAQQAVSCIRDNSYEKAPLPHARINELRKRAVRMSADIENILASRL
jgi:hypothetical protein